MAGVAIQTEIGYSNAERIVVRGKDLAGEIIGKLDFVDMLVLLALGRVPQEREKRMLNALLVTAADHGLTPITLSARLTFLGAPESLQGAVAAGLLGGGDTFLGTMQNVCDMLVTAGQGLTADSGDDAIRAAADRLVQERRASKQHIPGYGHSIHTAVDPRVAALAKVSRDNGYYGAYWRLALAIQDSLAAARGKELAFNAAGAMGAMYAELQLPPLMARGTALVGRCAGIVAHLLEEKSRPISRAIWDLVLEQDTRGNA